MKLTPDSQKWIRSALVGAALVASTSLVSAANITYTFDADAQGWGSGNGNTTVAWDNTQNRGGGGGGGCLKCTLAPTPGNNTMVAAIDVDYDTASHFGVEFDMYIDAASGTDGSGGYGNIQVGDFDAGWNWHGEWYGSVGGPAGNFATWRHVVIPFAAAYGPRAHLQIMVQSGSGDYSGNVVVYIDNIVFQDGTAPNQVYLYDFAWLEECVADVNYGIAATWSQDTVLHTNGAMKQVVNYGSGNTGWQESSGEFHTFSAAFDPAKFTYLDFDLYLDAPAGQSTYGQYTVHYWYSWTEIGTVALSASNLGKWTHYSLSLPAAGGNNPQGIVFHPGGNSLSNVFTYYIDNVTVWKPATPPTITQLAKETSASGVKITMDDNSNQYQRDAICVPSAAQQLYTWYGYTPITYSFTITNFPDATRHAGFEAHLYIVNQDTSVSGAFNQTYGGCDWNAADILQFRVENGTNGGVIARIDWKTNLPSANPLTNALYHPIAVNGPTALGTWSLTFTDNENGYITGPGITQTNFTLPPEAAAQFNPATVCTNSFVQFGMFKNDNANDGHNNGASGTFSEVSMNGGLFPFDDTFLGPGLTGSGIAWRTDRASAVQWVPSNTAWWLTWTTPDDGYSMKVSGNVTTPMASWSDAGVSYIYSQGATRVGAVPAASVPAGNSAFFRLAK